MSDLSARTSGSGTTAVLVHGSLATSEEWQAQQPLAEEGYRLVMPDRRGYGSSPPTQGEDFVRDGDDIAALMDGGAHLVGHSYGGLGAMVAAAQRPESTLSLALLEPPTFTLGHDDASKALIADVRRVWDDDLPAERWVESFLRAVGTDLDALPPGTLDEVVPLVPLLRQGRPAWDGEPPLAELASCPFPKLVVSGGHSRGFEAMCDELAERIDADRAVVEGAGHEIQLTGAPLNQALLALWAKSS